MVPVPKPSRRVGEEGQNAAPITGSFAERAGHLEAGKGRSMGRFVKRYRVTAFARGYQAGLEAIFALALAVGVGFWVDTRFETPPVFMMAGTAVGFGACVLRLLRYQRELDEREKAERGGRDDDATD